MYNIKPIDDKDFYTLLRLHYELQQILPGKHGESVSAIILCKELNRLDKIVIGLYKDNTLVGFINGYSETSEIFYFSNIYVLKEHRLGVKKLMTYAEDKIKELGYKAWKSESIIKEGKNILLKFGAEEI